MVKPWKAVTWPEMGRLFVTVAALLVVSYIALKRGLALPSSEPFLWIFCAALIACLLNVVLTRQKMIRQFWLAAASISFCLLLLEGVFTLRSFAPRSNMVVSGTMFTNKHDYLTLDSPLGYQLLPRSEATGLDPFSWTG